MIAVTTKREVSGGYTFISLNEVTCVTVTLHPLTHAVQEEDSDFTDPWRLRALLSSAVVRCYKSVLGYPACTDKCRLLHTTNGNKLFLHECLLSRNTLTSAFIFVSVFIHLKCRQFFPSFEFVHSPLYLFSVAFPAVWLWSCDIHMNNFYHCQNRTKSAEKIPILMFSGIEWQIIVAKLTNTTHINMKMQVLNDWWYQQELCKGKRFWKATLFFRWLMNLTSCIIFQKLWINYPNQSLKAWATTEQRKIIFNNFQLRMFQCIAQKNLQKENSPFKDAFLFHKEGVIRKKRARDYFSTVSLTFANS